MSILNQVDELQNKLFEIIMIVNDVEKCHLTNR